MTTPEIHNIFSRIQGYTPEIEQAIIKAVLDGGGEFLTLDGGRVIAVGVEK